VRGEISEQDRSHRVELERLAAKATALDAKLSAARAQLEAGIEADRRSQYLAVREARDEQNKLGVRRGFLAARAAECALPFQRLEKITGLAVEPLAYDGEERVAFLIATYFEKEVGFCPYCMTACLAGCLAMWHCPGFPPFLSPPSSLSVSVSVTLRSPSYRLRSMPV
jgi:hypothetical protein